MDTELETLDICGTGIRVSDNEEFRKWLSGIDFTYPEDCEASEEMETESSGGGGCAVASGGPGEGAYQFVMVALVLAAVAWGRRKNSKTKVSPVEQRFFRFVRFRGLPGSVAGQAG